MKLQAVFFDIDGTLFPTSEFVDRARAASVEAMIDAGVRMDPTELRAELDEVIREFSSNFEHHFDKLLVRVPKRVYKGINPAMIVAAGVSAYHQMQWRQLEPYEDAYEALRRLAKVDMVRGIVTEGLEIKQAMKLVRLDLARYLTPNAIFISHQLGISKPNVKLYKRACGDLNLKPNQCMYVGDNPATDIDPCNSIGIVTVRMRREGRYRDAEGETEPRYEVQNFWDLLEIMRNDFDVPVPEQLDG